MRATNIAPVKLCIDGGLVGGQAVCDNPRPVFSWAVESPTPQCGQMACRVRVCQSGDNGPAVWNSGWIQTAQQCLAYGGVPLLPGNSYRVAVWVRDEAGNEGFCDSWTFLTGLFGEWPAPWVAPQEDFGEAAIYYETTFTPEKRPLEGGTLYACGLGYQHIQLNGRDICPDRRLDPAPSSYHKRCYYTMHRLEAGWIKAGEPNTLAVAVAQGWRRNYGRYVENLLKNREIDFFGPPQLTAVLDIHYIGGSIRHIPSETEWVCRKGPVTFAHLFDGETCDARYKLGRQPALPCKTVPPPGENVKMCAQELEPVRINARVEPVAFWQQGEGYIFDMGINLAGVCELRLPPGLPAGIEITLRHAELLDGDGALYTAPLRGAKAEDRYITGAAAGETVWSPLFTYHGFRYVQVCGLPFVPRRGFLTGLHLYTSVDNASFFRCGDALANQIQDMVVLTERDNLHGIATDCPQRDERMGWLNDATVRFEELPYNFDAGRLLPKIVRDVCDVQEDGAITCTAPYVYGFRPADPVCSSFLVAAKESWMFYGNTELLSEVYPALLAWNECLARHTTDGVVNYSHYGDWAGPQDCCVEGSPRSSVTPGEFMSTGYHYMNWTLLAEFARALHKEADAARLEKEALATRQAMLRRWPVQDGAIATASQACQAFALRLGILPQAARPAAADVMNRAVLDVGGRLTTGNLCTLYLLEMLAEYGYVDTAWGLFTRTEYPSWGHMLQNGATTVWERFELKKDPSMNSHCHPMYGSVGKWLYSHIVGVSPMAPGCARVRVRPYVPAGLFTAQATVDTRMGELHVRWGKSYGKIHLHLSVPCGMQAEVCFGDTQVAVGGGTHWFQI